MQALGSTANYHGVLGLQEHAITMRRLANAKAVYARVLDLLDRPEAEPNQRACRALPTVVVGGAGYTGEGKLHEAGVEVRLQTKITSAVRASGRWATAPLRSSLMAKASMHPLRRVPCAKACSSRQISRPRCAASRRVHLVAGPSANWHWSAGARGWRRSKA